MTRQRRVILDQVRKMHSHPTADDLHRAVRGLLPHVSLATVYRSLEALSAAGMVRMLHLAGGQMRFDGTLDSHYHVRCVSCGRVEDVPAKPFPPLQELAEKQTRYRVLGHRLEFDGVCQECGAR
jgi:Fur family ferric uptake transcriptional regulator